MAPSVAGVHAPAFVERGDVKGWDGNMERVSPGFTPRPSLSGVGHGPLGNVGDECRRGSRPGLR